MNLYYSNILRIVSIIAVLIIHTTYASQKQFAEDLILWSFDAFFVLLNQLARFSVPVFVMLSGYGLASKYHQKEINLKEFYVQRFSKIGIPFLFWTILLLLIRHSFIIDEKFFYDLIYYLFVTGVDYHFYFFIIILQCYLVFPFIIKINNKIFLLILFILQLYNYSPTDKILGFLGVSYIIFPSTFLFSWLFYFYLGIFLKQNEEKFILFLAKYQFLLVFVLLISFIMMVYEYLYYSFNRVPFYNFDHFHRYSVLFYAVSFFMLFYSLTIKKPLFSFREDLVSKISHVTFAVYIFHTQILRILDIYLFSFVAIKTFLLILISFIIFIYINNFINKLQEIYYNNYLINIIKQLLGLI
jgi:surface polysaccharide O-acyltransferase-like enzyme